MSDGALDWEIADDMKSTSPAYKRALAKDLRSGAVRLTLSGEEIEPTSEIQKYFDVVTTKIADELDRQAAAQEN